MEPTVCHTCLSADRRRVFHLIDGEPHCHKCRPDLPLYGPGLKTSIQIENFCGNRDAAKRFDAWMDQWFHADSVTNQQAEWCRYVLTNRVPEDRLDALREAVNAFFADEQRANAKASARETEVANATGQWLGTPGGPVEDLGLLRCNKLINLGPSDLYPERGDRYLILFSDPQGNDVAWFTGIGKFDPEEGVEYDVRAKVKAHNVYNGRKQTVISHAKERKPDAE